MKMGMVRNKAKGRTVKADVSKGLGGSSEGSGGFYGTMQRYSE